MSVADEPSVRQAIRFARKRWRELLVIVLIGGFAVSSARSDDRGWAVYSTLVLAMLVFFVWQRAASVPVNDGESLGGGAFFKSTDLRPDEMVIEELGEMSLHPKRLGRLFLTNQRLICVAGRAYVPWGNKSLSIEIPAIVDVLPISATWWLNRPRLRIAVEGKTLELWAHSGADVLAISASLLQGLNRLGWRGRTPE